jgi:hypothetical protein
MFNNSCISGIFENLAAINLSLKNLILFQQLLNVKLKFRQLVIDYISLYLKFK